MLNDDDSVVLFMRKGCHVCARVKGYLTEQGIPFSTRDVDREPLTPHELWSIFNRKAGRLRVPFTVLNDGEDVVLGYDPLRLEGVFTQGDLGGWQASTSVSDILVYDDFSSPVLDAALWSVDSGQPSSEASAGCVTVTGDGTLGVVLPAPPSHTPEIGTALSTTAIRSLERFATPSGRVVTFEVEMAADGADASMPLDVTSMSAVEDVAGSIVFGFEVVGDELWAVHQRLLRDGVTLPEETFCHRVRVELEGSASETHRYSINYGHETNRVSWHADGRCVYWAILPNPVEGCSLLMSTTLRRTGRTSTPNSEEHLPPTLTRWTPWKISSTGESSEAPEEA